MRSNPEVHLYGAFVSGAIAFFSGLLPAPEKIGEIVSTAGVVNPLHRLAEVLRGQGMLSGGNGVDVWQGEH
jgi:hypothetical protein